MKPIIKIIRCDNMTNIDSKYFSYATTDNFYTTGDGEGYQGFGDEEKDKRVQQLCGEIHDRLKEIDGIIDTVKSRDPFETLKELGTVVDERDVNKPTPAEYWEKEAELLKKLNEEHKKREEAIRMSPEKFREPFTL